MHMEYPKEFLEELKALTLKHRLVIGGCGCCGSPHLSSLDEDYIPEEGHYKLFRHHHRDRGDSYDLLEWTDKGETDGTIEA